MDNESYYRYFAPASGLAKDFKNLETTIVWLTEYRTYGILISEGAHTATVEFNLRGETVTEEVENDEYTYWHDYAIEYERE